MTRVAAIIQGGKPEACSPWPRHVLSDEAWAAMIAALPEAPQVTLLALWADTVQVHALWMDIASGQVLFASTAVVAGCYKAVSPVRPIAAWFERMVRDLWGHAATGGVDERPWLDHGRWPHAQPMAPRPGGPGSPEPPELQAPESEEQHQVPLGPIHGGIEAASHLRLTGLGDTVVRMETRLGYTHKGTLTLMRGKSPRISARFAARLSGESTVAHTIAFARATEAALAIEPPPLAVCMRAVMAEIERIAGHLGDLGGLAASRGFAALETLCGRQSESLRRAASVAFGHRLMMDCVIPGGVAANIPPGGREAIGRSVTSLGAELPEIERLLAAGAMAGAPEIDAAQADRLAAGGVIGRAAGRAVDLRQVPGYPPYASLGFTAISGTTSPARLRLAEIGAALGLLRRLLDNLPEGPVSVPLPTESGEGIGFAEGFRGDIWHWLRLDHGQIAAVFVRDPGWALWPLLEASCAGRHAADIPVIQAMFGLASSGLDL